MARLAGVAVFDPNGEPVGRVRDVVVMFRPSPLPPRVLGLLVEIQHRRRIFVPIGRVTSIEAGAVVLASGSVNLRRFEQRAGRGAGARRACSTGPPRSGRPAPGSR